MQYKTITIERSKELKKGCASDIDAQCQQILNEQTAQGWKLLGIHTIEVKRKKGCLKIWWDGPVYGGYHEFQEDVLVFFREGDSKQPIEYSSENITQRYNNMFETPEEESQTPKKTMHERTMSVVSNVSSKVSGIASNAAEFLNSEETAQKMMDIKKKAASAMDAVSSKASGISESAREKMENETEKSDDESENS